ncbi:MAG: LysR family transcriptional regulator [Burkholderiaceae bacterium]
MCEWFPVFDWCFPVDIKDNLEAWRLFARVIEQGQISVVARERGLDPSTVSRRLSQLEEQLGFALLHRTTRTLQLTSAGTEALAKVRCFLRSYDDLLDEIRPSRLGLAGSVKLSSPGSLAEHFLADWLMRFQELNPRARVQLIESDKAVDPLSEAVDIALRTGSSCADASISYRIGSFSRGMSASPEYLRRFGVPKSPGDLVNHRVLRYGGGMREPRLFVMDEANPVELETGEPWMVSNSMATIYRAALSGHGIQLTTPWYVCGADIEAGRLVRVLADWPTPDMLVSAVCRLDGAHGRLVLAVIDWIRRCWEETPGLKP